MHSNIYPFKTEPFAHQLKAWELSKDKESFALFMEMGTGKSKVILDTAAYLYDNGKIDTLLIIAPKGAYRNWHLNEIPTHLPDHIIYRYAIWSASPRKKEKMYLNDIVRAGDELRIVIMNVEAFSSAKGVKWATSFLNTSRALMVIDESTTIKTPGANRTKAIIKLGRMAKYRRILTGEPVTRDPLDLYSQCDFLDEVHLGFSSFYSFRNRYAIMVNMNLGGRSFKKVTGFQRTDELNDILRGFSFRVKKDDCLDLPKKTYQYRHVDLTKEQEKAYQEMKDLCLTKADNELITVPVGTSLDKAKDILQKHRIEKLLVVDSDYNLSGLITVKDIQKNEDHPNACKDENGRLRVAAAVGVAGDAFERSRELINSNVDVIVVDTAHGHSKGVLKAISKNYMTEYPPTTCLLYTSPSPRDS